MYTSSIEELELLAKKAGVSLETYVNSRSNTEILKNFCYEANRENLEALYKLTEDAHIDCKIGLDVALTEAGSSIHL